MNAHELFGGNMAALLFPGAQDISELREVPDNQEVFVHKSTDQSLMVELLGFVDEPDEQAVRTHFEEISVSNDAVGQDNSRILSVECLPTNQLALSQCQSAFYLSGQQLVSKFNETARNLIHIHMGLLRLSQHGTDVLVVFNDPVDISAQSSSNVADFADVAPHQLANQNEGVHDARWTVEQFKECIKSLHLVNPEFLGD